MSAALRLVKLFGRPEVEADSRSYAKAGRVRDIGIGPQILCH